MPASLVNVACYSCYCFLLLLLLLPATLDNVACFSCYCCLLLLLLLPDSPATPTSAPTAFLSQIPRTDRGKKQGTGINQLEPEPTFTSTTVTPETLNNSVFQGFCCYFVTTLTYYLTHSSVHTDSSIQVLSCCSYCSCYVPLKIFL